MKIKATINPKSFNVGFFENPCEIEIDDDEFDRMMVEYFKKQASKYEIIQKQEMGNVISQTLRLKHED